MIVRRTGEEDNGGDAGCYGADANDDAEDEAGSLAVPWYSAGHFQGNLDVPLADCGFPISVSVVRSSSLGVVVRISGVDGGSLFAMLGIHGTR